MIKDPMGGTIKDFRKTYSTLENHLDRVLPTLLEMLPASDHS
jgi:hypothetical protein